MIRLLLITPLLIISCQKKPDEIKYNRWVDDIPFDAQLDNPDFQTCNGDNNIFQYFNFSNGMLYQGEKKALVNKIMKNYQAVNSDESGWIRIRFIVNCKGETGRFRMLESDLNYQEKKFDSAISQQLLDIVKSLDGWLIQTNEQFNNEAMDYYQYLLFKIEKGAITEILP